MKYKTPLFVISISLFSFVLNAQQASFGSPYEEPKFYFTSYITGMYGNGFFTVHQHMEDAEGGNIYMRNKPIIEKFDLSGNRIFLKEINPIDSGTKKKEMVYDGVYALKNNMVCIMYNRDLTKVYGIKISGDGIADSNNHVLLGKIINDNGAFDHGLPYSRYHFAVSADSTTFLAYYRQANKPDIHCAAFNENLQLLWTKDVTVPVDGKRMHFEQCIFNGSEAIFVFDIFSTKTEKPACGIFMYDKNTDATAYEKLNISSMKKSRLAGNSFLYAMNKNGDTFLGTVYTNDPSTNDPIGIYYVSINKNAAHIPEAKNIEFLPGYLSEYQKQKHTINCSEAWLDMNHLILTDDKSVFFGAEEMGLDKKMGYIVDYCYGDAVIGKISAGGTMEWVKRIPKKQSLVSDKNLLVGAGLCYSYNMNITGHTILLTYNENSNNLKTGIDEFLKNEDLVTPVNYIYTQKDSWNICLVTMDLSGNSIRRYCLNENDQTPMKYPPCFGNAQLSNNTFVLFKTDGTINLFSVPHTRYQLAVFKVD